MNEYKVYKFEELSDEAKEQALSVMIHINVEYEWWDFRADEIKNLGGELIGFDIDRGAYCELKFNCVETFAKNILENHGANCPAYKTSMKFKNGEIDDNEYEKDIQEDYRILLQKEYEYLTSDKAIKETIESNEYEFLENGNFHS